MRDKKLLISYLRAVAYQRLLMQPWIDDQYFMQNKGKIYYAVDTDIIKLYTAPGEMAIPSSKRKEGYAKIFPDDDSNLSIAIGRALSNHIFNRLHKKPLPLFIIPPIEYEIRDVFNAIARDAENESEEANTELELIKKNIIKLKIETDDEILFNKLKEIAPKAMNILFGVGYNAELRHFNDLLANTKIAPPEYILENKLIKDEKIRMALTPVSDITGWVLMYDLEKTWLEHLKRTKSQHKSSARIEKDAKAMARLEWIITHLNEQNYKLVYITGDTSLFKAAKKHPVIFKNKEHNFADLYLRHPRAFLAASEILTIPHLIGLNPEENQFIQSMDNILAKFEFGSRMHIYDTLTSLLNKNTTELLKTVEPVLKSNPDVIQEIQKCWREYTKNLVISYGSIEIQESTIRDDIRELKHDFKKLIDRVEGKLNYEIKKSWISYFKATTKAGYILLTIKKTEGQKYHSHCAPLLIFNSMKKTQKLTDRIISIQKPGMFDTQSYEVAITELTSEDPSGYSFYLAYALLFAQMNAWLIAANLSFLSINIARTCQVENISGREAYYLRTVALRHCVRHMHDLDRLPGLLDKAEECLVEDHRRRSSDIYGGEIRFREERISINFCYNLFSLFYNIVLPQNIPNLKELENHVKHELNQINFDIEKNKIVYYVERSLLTILLMISFLRWKKEDIQLNYKEISTYSHQLQQNLKLQEWAIGSYPVQVISLLTNWWLAHKNTLEKRSYNKKLKDLLDNPSIMKHALFPFDKKLYQFFSEIVQDNLI